MTATTRSDAASWFPGWRRLLIVAGLGVALGLASRLGDRLPSDAAWLFNMIGPWAAVAFFVGARGRSSRAGAVLGAAVLLAAVATYYAVTPVLVELRIARESLLAAPVWALGGLIGGALYGAAGTWWRRGVSLRPVGVALLGGLLAAEALVSFYRGGRSGDFLFGVELALGLALPWLLLDERRERGPAFGMVLVLSVGAFVAVSLIRTFTNSLGG